VQATCFLPILNVCILCVTSWSGNYAHYADCHFMVLLESNGSVKEPNISIYFSFPPITQWCSVSDVLFTSGRGVSDLSVLKYY